MTRYWQLRLADGSTVGPFLGSKAASRDAVLRKLDRKRLPRGAVLEDAYPKGPTTGRVLKMRHVRQPRHPRYCDRCGKSGALLTGRIGGHSLTQLCAKCDKGNR